MFAGFRWSRLSANRRNGTAIPPRIPRSRVGRHQNLDSNRPTQAAGGCEALPTPEGRRNDEVSQDHLLIDVAHYDPPLLEWPMSRLTPRIAPVRPWSDARSLRG